jgi:DNA-binding NarL/FixJ family response regulator
MPLNPDLPTTSVLLIDGNDTDRIGFANHLKRCSPDYQIFEATDGQSGLNLYRSRRVDCVVLALELPDQSGFQVLVELVPIASRPNIAVLAVTNRTQRGLYEIARQNGAYACFVKKFTSGDDLERAILRAMAFVGRMPKENRYWPV